MPERHSDISGTSTDDRPTYHPPQTVKRRFNFFRGMTVFGVPSLSALKSREAAKQADMPSRRSRPVSCTRMPDYVVYRARSGNGCSLGCARSAA